MALEKYNQKRDFSRTKEPKGIRKPSKGALQFVVQKHAASHLHYDFRLEIDGVLVSWAVPKGPSSDPKVKHLAMHVEDHPMDYLDFEGTIPKGEYGGGTVMVWDIGTYHAEGNEDATKDNQLMKRQLHQRSIKIVLEGGKLKGAYHLFGIGDDDKQWLLKKADDSFADGKPFDEKSILTGRDFDAIAKGDDVWTRQGRKSVAKKTKTEKSEEDKQQASGQTAGVFSAADLQEAKKIKAFPEDWRPQLATLTDAAFDNPDWIFENKYDGYRALAQLQNKKATLISRNGLAFNDKYTEIATALDGTAQDIILDGEIVVEDSKGRSRFQWLQQLDDRPKQGKLKFYVFDILYFQGYDLRGLDLLLRKKILRAVLPNKTALVYSEHIVGNGIHAFETISKNGGEGIIAKKANSKYHTDRRSREWLKIKAEKQQEMVIGGYTDPKGGRVGIGALLCGFYQDGQLIYSGKVGSGFTEPVLKDLRTKLEKMERKSSPFAQSPKENDVHWVTPKLIAQLKFSEITDAGSMRHPVYLGLRTDKDPKSVGIESPEVSAVDVQPTSVLATDKPKKNNVKTPKNRVEFSNLDKLFWPVEKITKGDVITYYQTVAPFILPYLKDRPQSLRRTPDGVKSAGFFQKDVAGKVPKWIKTRKIKSDSAAESIEWLICNDEETLLFLANWGCIELNPWSSRVGSLNHPDYIIFDLDPKGAPMENIAKTAHKVKEVLDALQVPAYLKTSGGNGLHVFIPILPKYTYEQTREFSHLVSQMVVRDLPEITSLERMPDKRKGKVYLDFLQNGRGKTMASIYSLRPREGAGVSTPLSWDEVDKNLDLKAFNIHTVPDRIAEKGDLWAGFFDDAIDLKTILKRI